MDLTVLDVVRVMQKAGTNHMKVTITPSLANSIWWGNKINRDLKMAKAEGFARTMLADEWIYTTQTITITESGILVDGQHRIWALTLSGKTLPFLIAVISDSEADKMREKIDYDLTPRSRVDIFQIHALQEGAGTFSQKHVHILNAMSSLIFRRKPTLNDQLEIEAVFGQDIADMLFACATNRRNRTSASVKAAFVLRLHLAEDQEAQNHLLDQWRTFVLYRVENANELRVDNRVLQLIGALDTYQAAVKRGGSISIDADLATLSWQGWDQAKRNMTTKKKLLQHPVAGSRNYDADLEKFHECFFELSEAARKAMPTVADSPLPLKLHSQSDLWA